jgi:hypothetical protein|tara:strand:- start:2693 stop:2842 length:150 start_codon:yes stop_codon:yes gene_type:complete
MQLWQLGMADQKRHGFFKPRLPNSLPLKVDKLPVEIRYLQLTELANRVL